MSTNKHLHLADAFTLATRWILYTLTFSLPLFFLPWGTSILELNKQMLLMFLAVAGMVAWLGGMVVQKKVYWRKGALLLIPFLFVVSVFVASCLSVAGYQTWVGQAAQEYTSFLSFILYLFVFYLAVHVADHERVFDGLIKSLLASGAVSGVLVTLSILGIARLPFIVAQSSGFNTVGTLNGAAQFLLVTLFVGLAYWLVSGKGKKDLFVTTKLFILLISLSTVFLLFILDFWVFWVMLIVGVFFLCAFSVLQTKQFPQRKRFAFPFLLLILSVVMLFVSAPSIVDVPFVVSPSYETSWSITKQTLAKDTSQFFFGSGPGTFLQDFQLYKPAVVNESAFWQTDFDRAKSWVLTMVATLGVVSAGLWLLFICWLGIKGLGRLLRKKDVNEWQHVFVVFSGWVISALGHILYSSNTTLQFVFWLLSGLLVAGLFSKVKEKTFARAPRLGLLVSLSFGVVAIILFSTIFIGVQRYSAELAFAHAVELDEADTPISEVIEELERSVQFNKWSDIYYRNLSSAYFAQAQEYLGAVSGQLTEEQMTLVLESVGNSVNAINTATALEPALVTNWAIRGVIYREVMSFAPGAEDFAAESFLNATILEPSDPLHFVDLARVYLIVADRNAALVNAEDADLAASAQENVEVLLGSAEQALVYAVTVKPDYLVAHYYLAAVYERQDRLLESAERLLALRNNDISNIGLAFQLSVMLMRLEEYDLAREELERIIGISPNYANALWYLSALYNLQGDIEGAIALAGQVLELDPGNTIVVNRIEQLKAGLVVEEIPEPVVDENGTIIEVPEGEVVESEG
jgi:hypothetical protein